MVQQREPLLRRIDWESFYLSVEKVFSLLDADDVFGGDTTEYSKILLDIDLNDKPDKVADLIELYRKNNALLQLGQGVTASIELLLSPMISQAKAEAWVSAWQIGGVDLIELEIPIRLLSAAVMWKAKPDIRVLLSLPAEERRILEELLPKST
jgi:hypothetical protein